MAQPYWCAAREYPHGLAMRIRQDVTNALAVLPRVEAESSFVVVINLTAEFARVDAALLALLDEES